MQAAAGLAAAAMVDGGAATAAAAAPRMQGYVDGLSFLPEDLDDVADSGLGAMICDVSEVEEVKDAQGVPRYLRTYKANRAALEAAVKRIATRSDLHVALRGADLGTRPGSCAVVLQLQSCEPIEKDLGRLAQFHAMGLRVLQFTHHNNNLFAGGALETAPSGLTPLGIEGLAEMNRIGLLPDASHGSEKTILEAARRSTTPIVLSHGACRAIVDHPRCFTDDAIRAVAAKGGAIGIFMMSFWLTRDPVPATEHLIAQLRHVIKVGGIGAVGIANDFPARGQLNLLKLGNNNRTGVAEYLDWWKAMRGIGIPGFGWTPEHVVIPELNNIYRLRLIEQALERARFRSGDIERIMGGNWRRVLTDVLR